jgi:very-short-patch-repair endonuclease
MTPAEAAFWKLVKNSKFEGRKFCRQHSVGNYILDFYCPSEKLAVELDGQPHYSTAGRISDIDRDSFLEAKGIRVVRIENRHVFEETEWVLDLVRTNFRFGPPVQKTSHAPHSSIRNVKTTPSVSPEADETATPPS